jgi:hydrogenase-4 component F
MRRAAGGDHLEQASGLAALMPWSTRIFVAGVFAVTACPPFAPFFSELRMVRAAFASGHALAGAGFLACLLVAFFGLTRLAFAVAEGRPSPRVRPVPARLRERPGVVIPPLLLLALSLYLGLFTPHVLSEAWSDAVASLSPSP